MMMRFGLKGGFLGEKTKKKKKTEKKKCGEKIWKNQSGFKILEVQMCVCEGK
jgi:hypothetical protein